MYVEFPLPFIALIFPLIFNHFHLSFLKHVFFQSCCLCACIFFMTPVVLIFGRALFFLSLFFVFLQTYLSLILLFHCIFLDLASFCFEALLYTGICLLSVLYLWLIFGYIFHLFTGNINMNILHLSYVFHASFLYFSIIYLYESHADSHLIFTHL